MIRPMLQVFALLCLLLSVEGCSKRPSVPLVNRLTGHWTFDKADAHMYVSGATLCRYHANGEELRVLFNAVHEDADERLLDIRYQVETASGPLVMEERFRFDDQYLTVIVSSRVVEPGNQTAKWVGALPWLFVDKQICPQQ